MDITAHCPLAVSLANRLRASRAELTARWLERISDRVSIEPTHIFPTEELLDHMPLLIEGIADYIEDPTRVIAADVPVVAKAMELGALRYEQRFDEYEILKEYEIFGGILFAFLARIVDDLEEPCSRGELLVCAHRLFRAVALIQQATLTNYLRLMRERLREREERLRGFNRTVTHEFKNRIGAAMGAAQILEMHGVAEAERQKLLPVVVRNLDSMRAMLDNLIELTKIEVDARQQRHVLLPHAAAEVHRQLRDAARAEGVEIRFGDLPPVEINAAAVELVLTNYLSNAIKYADHTKPVRWVEFLGYVRQVAEATQATQASAGPAADASAAAASCELVVEVRDNGLGVPQDARGRLFERYFRAHERTTTGVEGTGLGLSIVRETVEALGGRAWAEFPDDGSLFAFAIPCRRASDAAATDPAGRGRARRDPQSR